LLSGKRRVEIGRVFGKEKQFGAYSSDRPANGFSLLASEQSTQGAPADEELFIDTR